MDAQSVSECASHFDAGIVYLTIHSMTPKKMKTLKFMVCSLCLLCMAACSNGIADDDLFANYKNEPNAKVTAVPRMLLHLGVGMAKANADDKDERKAIGLASKITAVRILDLDDCSREVKQRFMADVKNMGENGYETLMKVNDDGENVKLLLKREGTDITELLIINTSESDAELVQLKGRIREEEISRIMESDLVDD